MNEITVHLSSTDIRALFTAPKQLVPAPGVGKAIVPIAAIITYRFATTPYAIGSFLVIGPVGVGLLIAPEVALIDQSWDMTVMFAPGVMGSPIAFSTPERPSYFLNKPLLLFDGSANPTLGDGTATVTVWYAVVTL